MNQATKKIWIVLAVILAGLLVFIVPRLLFSPKGTGFGISKKTAQIYYCPMHPTYTSHRPGDCPICNMKLVPKPSTPQEKQKKERKILYYRHPMGQPDTSPVPKKDSMGMDYIPVYEGETREASQVEGHAVVQIPMEKQQLMGVKVGMVEKRKLVKEIRTSGRVVFDPELYAAQQEFLSAVAQGEKAHGGPYHEPLERAQALAESAKTRLRLLGMSEEEIAELQNKSVQDKNLILPPGVPKEPLSLPNQFVWVYATVYEYEMPWVKVGDPAKIKVATLSDREFAGEVRAVDPVLDPVTRSARARIRVENSEGILRPEMYVDVYLRSELGDSLAVPVEAVMPTGERSIVFVAREEGMFEPREVGLGPKAENFYVVTSGLAEGERVATSGNFLIDSESRLQSALTGAGSGAHQHGQ